MTIEISDAKVFNPKRHHDNRGFFTELFDQNNFAFAVKQINHSYSIRGTLRGIHKAPFEKLVTCIQGRIFDVCVDLRQDSKTYLQHVAVELSAENGKQLLVPKDCGHAFLALEDSMVVYSQSDTYNPSGESSVRYDDPTLNIEWPVMDYIISSKDAINPFIEVDGHTTQLQSQRRSDYLEGWL